MDVPSPPSESEAADPNRGKIRTWWHPLLANCLRWELGNTYKLEEEVPVGLKPLQIDILLLRKQQGDLPLAAQQALAGLVDHLNDMTMLEFKSPSDDLRAGDFQTFIAYSLLYRAQNDPLLPPEKLHLLVVAPHLTKGYRDELTVLNVTAREEQPGIWSLQGGPLNHRTWVLETAVLAEVGHPLLMVFSPQFLQHSQQVYAQLRDAGYTDLVVYVAQQVQQFKRRGREFAMQHLGAEDELEKVLLSIAAELPPEKLLAGLSYEERLQGMPSQARVQGLSPEERLGGLTSEELEHLRQLLQQLPPPETDPSSKV